MLRKALQPYAMVARPSPAPSASAPSPGCRATASSALMASDKLKVQHDRILVKPVSTQTGSPGGLLLGSPAKTATDPWFGTVVAMGDKVSMELSKGDSIMYHQIGTTMVDIDEEPHEFVPQTSVVGRME